MPKEGTVELNEDIFADVIIPEVKKPDDQKTPEQIAEEAEAKRLADEAEAQRVIDEKKKIVKPVETELDAEGKPIKKSGEGDEQDESVIQALAKLRGLELTPEDIEAYDDSYEGIDKFYEEKVATAKAETILNEFFEEHPVAGEFFDFLQLGGKPEEFFKVDSPEIDYKTLDLTNDDVKKAVLKTWFKKQEYTDTEATEAITSLEATGLMDAQVKLAASKLEVIQAKEKATKDADLQKTSEDNNKKIKEFWGGVESTINKGQVKNFTIPTPERVELFKYMAKPVKGGKSQEMLDRENEDLETKIAIAFIRKHKLDLGKFITQAAATSRATTLKEKIASSANKLKSAGSSTPTENVNNLPDIDFANFGKETN